MIKDLVMQNRSYRRFDQKHKIEQQELIDLVELARLSPSPRNKQALRFALSASEKQNETIFQYLAWAGYLKDWKGARVGERPTAYICILADNELSSNHKKDFLGMAAGIAAQSILLGATERGLGGCMIAAFQSKKILAEFDLTDRYEVLLVLAIGKPIEQVQIETMKSADDYVYWRDEQQVHHVPKRALVDLIIYK